MSKTAALLNIIATFSVGDQKLEISEIGANVLDIVNRRTEDECKKDPSIGIAAGIHGRLLSKFPDLTPKELTGVLTKYKNIGLLSCFKHPEKQWMQWVPTEFSNTIVEQLESSGKFESSYDEMTEAYKAQVEAEKAHKKSGASKTPLDLTKLQLVSSAE